jgi:glycosyltransferase involved in cell wall biosynthesis
VRVLLTVASLRPNYGGPAFSVSQLARALAGQGAQVALWAPDGSAETSELVLPTDKVTRLGGNEADAMTFLEGGGVLHDNGIWLAHNHRLARLAKTRSVPRIVSTRGMLEPWARNHKRFKKDLAWLAYQKRDLATAAALHATAQAEGGNLVRQAIGPPVEIISNGIDSVPSRPRAPVGELKTALFVGRLYPVKGLPMLVEAWSRSRPEGWRLQIAGPDEAGHRAEVEAVIARYSLQDQVSFLGPVAGDAKQAAYFDADLFVLPSHSESFGMAVGEALAHGLPVLTTKAAPWPMLPHRGCGWWVNADVDGLASGLSVATALSRENLFEAGAKGRALITEAFSWSASAKAFLGLYEKVL